MPSPDGPCRFMVDQDNLFVGSIIDGLLYPSEGLTYNSSVQGPIVACRGSPVPILIDNDISDVAPIEGILSGC